MKKLFKKRSASKNTSRLNDFVRGFISTGLISAIDQCARGHPPFACRGVLRRALQGGAALTAAVAAGHAAQRRDVATLVTVAAAGAASIYAIDYFLRGQTRAPETEQKNGQEIQVQET